MNEFDPAKPILQQILRASEDLVAIEAADRIDALEAALRCREADINALKGTLLDIAKHSTDPAAAYFARKALEAS